MTARRVLIVDHEPLVRRSVADRLRADGHEPIQAGSVGEALELAAGGVDLVLLDHGLPGDDHEVALSRLHDLDPDLLVILAASGPDAVVTATKSGAFDGATKPFDLDDVAARVERALEVGRLRRDVRSLRDGLARPYGPASIVGESDAMQRVKLLARKLASSPGSTVLVTGEPGTGKGLIARVVHYASSRAARPFLAAACSAARPGALVELEMFGDELGGFADAGHPKRGAIEQAGDGTIFLDEIGELTPALQARLLRLLEEKTLTRVGGTADMKVDVRVIAATTRNLEALVQAGTFREDLYYRLNVLRIEMPPLRARTGDVPLLARHFVERFSREFERPARGLSRAAEAVLEAAAWPGNVRELRNVMERAVWIGAGETLEPADFDALHPPRAPAHAGPAGFTLPEAGVNLEDIEKSLVIQALERAGGNQTRAATLLGLHRDQIRYRVEKFGLKKAELE